MQFYQMCVIYGVCIQYMLWLITDLFLCRFEKSFSRSIKKFYIAYCYELVNHVFSINYGHVVLQQVDNITDTKLSKEELVPKIIKFYQKSISFVYVKLQHQSNRGQ